MVQNNKVLTVSYGTFSCTLEGFEDSFGTMKAIAEYFRDLASDDRYFGAEPPQPDADMLARIAQREIARQVEARTSHEGIHLRAGAPEAQASPPAAAPHMAPDRALHETPPGEVDFFVAPEDAKTQAEAAPPAAAEAEEQVFSLEGSVEEPFADDVDDGFVENTEASVEVAPAAEPEETPPGVVDFFVDPEEAHANAIGETSEETVAEDDDPVNLEQIAAVVAADEAAQDAPAIEEDAPEDITAETVDAPAPQKPAANSIAAKLQRIRAVVSRTPVDEFSEDQHAEAVSQKAKNAAQEIAEDINASLNAAETEADMAADAPAEEDSDALISRALEELNQPEAQSPDQPRRARVIRVRRGINKPAAASTGAASPAVPAGPPSTLSDADEDDLRRELAAVEAELLAATRGSDDANTSAAAPNAEGDDDEQIAEHPAAPEPQPARAGSRGTSDTDVSRLMAAADEKLGDPNTASSRETYSHMRAAVAAAQNVSDAADDDVEKHYREDLASATVHPRRPVVRRKTPRPELSEARATPLKLVAEQRVNTDTTETAANPAQPIVRPRRVMTSSQPRSAEGPNTDTGFAKYAQETGAVDLPELLEAAASYLSFVKGQDVFSRPELINKVRTTGTEFNREDSMRSFGQLLRDGKIARKRNGRFAASDQIGFQPQDRAAG